MVWFARPFTVVSIWKKVQQSDGLIGAVLRKLCNLRLEEYHQAEELASDMDCRNANKKVALVESKTVGRFIWLIPTLNSCTAGQPPWRISSCKARLVGSLPLWRLLCHSHVALVSQGDSVSNRHDSIQWTQRSQVAWWSTSCCVCDDKPGEIFKSQDSNVTDNSPRDQEGTRICPNSQSSQENARKRRLKMELGNCRPSHSDC